MARDKVSICNAALDELPADNIQTLDDVDSIGARVCRRVYPSVIADLIAEWEYEGAVRRVRLAETVNDRPGEWLACYVRPGNVASLLRVLPDRAAGYGSPVVLPGQTVATEWVGWFPENAGLAFAHSEARIYCNVKGATLEYVTDDPDLGTMTPLFCRAAELELAARIVMPILKSPKRQADLIRMAEVARQRAIADDRNNTPERWGMAASEEALLRQYDASAASLSYWPGA